jgi:MscS family membrane protein
MDFTSKSNYFDMLKHHYSWLIELALGLAALFTLQWVLTAFIKKISRSKLHHPTSWAKKMDFIFLPPLKTLFVVLGLYYTLSVLAGQFSLVQLLQSAKPFFSSAVILLFSWVALRWKKELLTALQQHPKMVTTGLSHTLGKILSMIIVILTALIILQIFHLDIWPLLAFGGIGAAAVGFAAKDVISNFCGGLMLSITRPFLVGDHIILPSMTVEGPVEEIGWYLTVIRDKDKRPVYLPNAIFSNALVINNARMTHRRILEQLSIRYADFAKVKSLNAKIREFIKKHPSVDPSIEPLVFLEAFNESSLGIYLDVYVLSTQLADFLKVKEALLMGIYEIMECEAVKMPYPTYTIETVQSS